MPALSEKEKWLLSFYRHSEIAGALFFGRLARTLRAGPVQVDMTKHFADEATHSHLWTKCITDLGEMPIKLHQAYQDQYLEAAGLPVNMMEILAITLVFERRVIGQYVAHSQVPDLAQPIRDTLGLIMEDEKWHIRWVSDALKGMEAKLGKERIEATIRRFTDADREVYQKVLAENEEMLRDLMTYRAV